MTRLEPAPVERYEQFLTSGEIRLQVCDDCGNQIFYPRVLCPACGSLSLTWTLVDGRGTVYSTTTIRRRPDRGGDYDLSVVELDGGARMMSRVEGIAPELVTIGQRVRARITPDDGRHVIVFDPEAGA